MDNRWPRKCIHLCGPTEIANDTKHICINIGISFGDSFVMETHLNVGNFQTSVEVTRTGRQWSSRWTNPPDLRPNGALVTALEDHFVACR